MHPFRWREIDLSSTNLVLQDRYEMIAEIGRGGMSVVYLAKDKMLGSYWAVKKVINDGGKDIQAFKKEVELLSGLNHADIPRIVDKVEYDGCFYVVMDFVDGASLGKKVLAEGPQPESTVVEWAKMLCDVLEYLHTVRSNPIVYSDLKPDNIMLTKAGRVKLIDFGIAKECVRGSVFTGEAVGTKGYAAPEQYRDASNILDERTDIYSFGASLAYILTGIVPTKPPHGVKSVRELDPKLSEGIDYIIGKCTKDDPDERYKNFAEVRADLNVINELTGAYRRKMRNRLLSFYLSTAACLLCLIPTSIGYSAVQAQKADNYQYYYQQASVNLQNGDNEAAAQNYLKAIGYKSDLVEPYLLYFNSMLPRVNDENYNTLTKTAIDLMRNSYLDNKRSEMYQNEEIAYQVMKKCVEVSDPAYANYALTYIDILKKKSYKSQELGYYEIIASNATKSFGTQDFESMGSALDDLVAYTEYNALPIDDKLENYYAAMKIYSEYPNEFTKANDNTFSYDRVYELGVKAKDLIDRNMDDEDTEFAGIIPMYEMVASGQYKSALTVTDKDKDVQKKKKTERYERSIEWFGFLDELNDDLSQQLWLKKAGAYQSLFDLNKDDSGHELDEGDVENLTRAVEEYEKIMAKYPECFQAQMYLAGAYLDEEMLKDKEERDFTKALDSYRDSEKMSSSKDLSKSELSVFAAIKRKYINAGLIEE